MTAGRSRAPFAPGNSVSVRHGAKSTRRMEALADAKLAEIRSQASWIEDVDQHTLRAWLVAEARCDTLRRHTDLHGLVDEKGRPTGAADFLIRCERQASDLRSRLGLDPLSRGRLGRDVAVAHAVADAAVRSTAEAGRRIREQREAGQ